MSEPSITDANAEPTPMPPQQASQEAPKAGPGWIGTTLVAISISTLAMFAYEKGVRDPRTPKLGTVDVADLFASNQAKVLKEALGGGSTSADPTMLGQKAAAAMSSQIQAFTKECNCMLIASPAVFGATPAITDYTQHIKEINELTTSLSDLASLGSSGNAASRPQVTPLQGR